VSECATGPGWCLNTGAHMVAAGTPLLRICQCFESAIGWIVFVTDISQKPVAPSGACCSCEWISMTPVQRLQLEGLLDGPRPTAVPGHHDLCCGPQLAQLGLRALG